MPYSSEQIIGVLAGILEFSAFILYYISILQGKTRPNRATWFVLTIVGFLIVASYYASGARETIWIPVSYAVGPLIALPPTTGDTAITGAPHPLSAARTPRTARIGSMLR